MGRVLIYSQVDSVDLTCYSGKPDLGYNQPRTVCSRRGAVTLRQGSVFTKSNEIIR